LAMIANVSPQAEVLGRCMEEVFMKPWLHQMAWEEVRDHLRKDDVVIVPIGSTEQHGRHCPLRTDSMVAIALAEDAAKEAGTLIAPPIWFGWSAWHMGYPGSITIRPEVLKEFVSDVVVSLVCHGFARVIILNGHRMANLPILEPLAQRVKALTGAYVAVVDPHLIGRRIVAEVRESEPGGFGHADEIETSHMLHIHPDLVDMSVAVKNVGTIGSFYTFHLPDPQVDMDAVYLPSTQEEFLKRTQPSGVFGDPTLATREKGELYHRAVVSNLVRLIEEARRAPVTLKDVRPPI